MEDKERELLTMLAEECAEVIHTITKSLRHGKHSKNPYYPNGDTNAQSLQREFSQLVTLAVVCGLDLPDPEEQKSIWNRKMWYTHHQDTAQ